MKIRQKLMFLSVFLFMISGSLPVHAEELSDNAEIEQSSFPIQNDTSAGETRPATGEYITNPTTLLSSDGSLTEEPTIETEPSTTEPASESESAPSTMEIPPEAEPSTVEPTSETEPSTMEPESQTADQPSLPPEISVKAETLLSETAPVTTTESAMPSPDVPPMFEASIEYYSHGYYVVMGSFTEFLPDTILVRPLCSLDGENWEVCGQDWDLSCLNMEGDAAENKLHNQICLYNRDEPFKSYLDGELDSFYLKLHITRENGESYETQAVLIERGGPQTVPEEIVLIAGFAPSMRVREQNPFALYGRYQITIGENTTPEELSALLPDTIPVQIDLCDSESNFIANDFIDCPVTWKPLSFSRLTAGESMTIPDAAENIVIPGGTLLNTPVGSFQLNEPLVLNHGLSNDMNTDEIRLILNLVSEKESLTGILTEENDGLEIAFPFKPTGASSIRAYTLSADDEKWEELPALSLDECVNAQPSTANSGYALVMPKDREPYRSYLAAQAAGEEPSPFLIGLEIEGGIYDGQQIILPWPGTYNLPLSLPKLGGSGGNEGNAGAGNKNDSTEEGQRPGLPQQPEENGKETETAQTPETENDADKSDTDKTQTPENSAKEPQTTQTSKTETSAGKPETDQTPEPTSDKTQTPKNSAKETQTAQTSKTENRADKPETSIAPAPTSTMENSPDKPAADNARELASDKTQMPENSTTPGQSAASTHASATAQAAMTPYGADSETAGRRPSHAAAAASAAGICIFALFHKASALRKIQTALRRLLPTK